MLRIFAPQPEGGYKKLGRFWYLFKIIKYAVIVACIILLPLNQYFHSIDDDFTPAFPRNSSVSSSGDNTVLTPSTDAPTSEPSSTSSTPPLTVEPTSSAPVTKRSVGIPPKIPAENPDDDPEKLSEWRNSVPMFRVKRNPKNKTGFDDDDDDDDDDSKTRLSDLLIMYPCCTTILIMLGMEMCGQMLLDPMAKWTNLFLIVLCVGLSLVVFVVSLLAALRTLQAIMIVISVLSMVFLILEIVDFVFIYLA